MHSAGVRYYRLLEETEGKCHLLQVEYYVIRPLHLFIREMETYYVVGSRQEGTPGERVDIVRKFNQEKDRDAFESCLKDLW